MRLLTILVVASTLVVGCKTTGTKPPSEPVARNKGQEKESNSDPLPFWADRGATNRPTENPSTPTDNDFSGILAGRVVDTNGRGLPRTLINISEASAQPGGAPKGIETDEQGFFMIRGLKTSATYFLACRAEDQGRVLGGSAIHQPPSTRIEIRLSEGNVSSITPNAVPNPGNTGPFAPKTPSKLGDPPISSVPGLDPVKPQLDPLLGNDESWSPGKVPPASRNFPPPPASKANNGNIAMDVTATWPPSVNIPGPGSVAPPPTARQEIYGASGPGMSAEPVHSSPVGSIPSIQEGSGKRDQSRVDFTLYDLTGRPWNFRNRSTSLTLLDFWSTTCNPCLNAIPRMVDLQARYGADGLEVMGVTCEEPARFSDQVDAIDRVKARFASSRFPINYRMYLEGTGFEGRVQKQFRVTRYPTMILIDAGGREVWRSDRKESTTLEDAIKYYLRR